MKFFKNLLNNNNIKYYSRNSSLGAVFAERFNRTIKDLLKLTVFEKRDGNWIDVLPTVTKHYNNRKHSSIELTPKQASLTKSEGYVYQKLLDKRNKIKPRFQVYDLVRTADLKRTFPKGDTSNWSDKLCKITEIINDTIPSYPIYNLPERSKEALLKKTDLTLKENTDVMNKLNLNSIKLPLSITTH